LVHKKGFKYKNSQVNHISKSSPELFLIRFDFGEAFSFDFRLDEALTLSAEVFSDSDSCLRGALFLGLASFLVDVFDFGGVFLGEGCLGLFFFFAGDSTLEGASLRAFVAST